MPRSPSYTLSVSDRVDQRRVGRGERAGGQRRLGRIEEADEPELLGHAVRHLDHAERGHVGVLRQERHRLREDDLAVGVADRDRRRVAVAHQVDAVARHLERVVDAHLALLRALARDLRGQVGDEVARLPGALLAGRLVRHAELVEGERVRGERLLVDEAARVERRVVEHRVDEGAALDDHALPGVGEAAADADRHQHADERGVEDEVAASRGGSRARPRPTASPRAS